jgi:hypothetical protein
MIYVGWLQTVVLETYIMGTQDQTPPTILQDKGFYITFQIFNNIGKTNGKQS